MSSSGTAAPPVNPAEVRMGRAPAVNDPRTLKLSTFLRKAELPAVPPAFSYRDVMSSIPMHANNRFGDCVEAAPAHLIQAQTAARGAEFVPTEEMVLGWYSNLTGFDRHDPSTDNGTNMLSMLKAWKRDGFAGLGDHKILGFAAIDPQSWYETRLALWLFGGCLIGAELPVVAQRQDDWKLDLVAGADAKPGSWGRHCMAVLGAELDPRGRPVFPAVTWGREKNLRSSFWDGLYVEEAYIVVSRDWVPPGGKSIHGFDDEGLLAAMREVSR